MKVKVKRALISVSDKTGLAEFGRRLAAAGVEIVSSGGTSSALTEAGVKVTPVSEVTGAPEMLGGRVKTLHPRIHAGILARSTDPDHGRQLEEHGIESFQLVVVNLYPFAETAARAGVSEEEVIEQIDIGGPALIRAAAKNYESVAVLTVPSMYGPVADQIEAGGIEDDLRRLLAREAFFHTAGYDAAIVAWMHREDLMPGRMVLSLRRQQVLRYGENPHQTGAAYTEEGVYPPFDLYQGKEMSFNNYLDVEASRRLVFDIDEPAAVIVKHTNPCGVALAVTITEAFTRAWECDPVSAFGGVVALNRQLDADTARAITEAGFIEAVSAPSIAAAASSILATKKDLRVLATAPTQRQGFDLRRIEGGMVAQEWDAVNSENWKPVTSRPLSDEEAADLRLAWTVAAHTKSNAVVVAVGGMAVGIGAGDQSRVGAAQRALAKAGDRATGAVAASDAFFPFPDGLEVLAEGGIVAIVAPGGSKRDAEVTAAAERLRITLFLAEQRHFRH
ncbi:MAG TPA: bifunctional phosphoribosylaminoimidazolecarboxamide formyltransferase/IMP cyclohydrolase [Acidimicrobiia bacterium]|nr:bifunctional phosphoribosylaminoimidazolecarboxamide formyltransferase/IMP cyclohydrolase [Acidimicrobiia bacterium]